MERQYLCVSNTSAQLDPEAIRTALGSLHKLTENGSGGLLSWVNPLHGGEPITFEFVVTSEGAGRPVEFYYGADDNLDALAQRLRSIYPRSFEIDDVEVDLTKQLLPPVSYSADEFTERLEAGQLYHDSLRDIAEGDDPREVVDQLPTEPGGSNISQGTILAPTVTDDGEILARPAVSEVEPVGVQWWGEAERRKDWMTTFTGITDILGSAGNDSSGSGFERHPLVQLIERLVELDHPAAFQVVFRRHADWSRDARRREGELYGGTDTLSEKLLGAVFPDPPQSSSTSSQQGQRPAGYRVSSTSSTTHSVATNTPSLRNHPEAGSRYELVSANNPKRTLTVNLQLLALAVDEDDRRTLESQLDPLRSIFDPVDGPFYEIRGRRLRTNGRLPWNGSRDAGAALDRFTSCSLTTGGRRFPISNRREIRPDLTLNGDELGNFVVIPPADALPEEPGTRAELQVEQISPVHAEEESATRSAPDESASTDTDLLDTGLDGAQFDTDVESVVHRDDELEQIARFLAPVSHGETIDPLLVTGPPGSGKTCTVKLAVDRFQREESAVNAFYVNCWEHPSRFEVLYRILDGLEPTLDIHRQATPTDVLLDRLRDYDDYPCLVVLDEVDQLDDKSLLYDLLNLPRFSFLCITNQAGDLLTGLDERLESRLRACEHLRFDRYSEDQVVDILSERLSDKEGSQVVRRKHLEYIAQLANGDARVAVNGLRIAIRRADDIHDDGDFDGLIEAAIPEAREEIRMGNLDSLTPHQQVVFELIDSHQQIEPSDLYQKYRQRVEDPKSDRTIRNYLAQLEEYGLITAAGSTHDRVYRSVH